MKLGSGTAHPAPYTRVCDTPILNHPYDEELQSVTQVFGSLLRSIVTTIDEHGRSLYAVNARFMTPPEEDTPYWITRVRR